MQSEIAKKIGLKVPIFQGAMAWIADGHLAAAVSNAGGLGIIAGGNAPADVVRSEIQKARQLTDRPFAVNVMLLSPHAEEVAQVVYEEKVAVVTTGAGSPAKYISKWKENGTIVIPVVPSVAYAKRMEREGADAVVAEGMEAGGHIGKLTTMALTPQVVDAVSIPVISAGGIGDGRGVAAALMLGADAVQMGTRFLVAKECFVHENYKQSVMKSKDIDSVVTGESTGHPVRVIRNKMSRQYEKLEKSIMQEPEPNYAPLEELGAGSLRKAAVEGRVNEGSIMAGQIAGMVNKEQSCQEVIDEVMDEAKEVMRKTKI